MMVTHWQSIVDIMERAEHSFVAGPLCCDLCGQPVGVADIGVTLLEDQRIIWIIRSRCSDLSVVIAN